MKKFSLLFPWLVIGLSALYFAMRTMPPHSPENGMDLRSFGGITVQDHGRYKPIDTYARTALMSLNHKQTVTAKEKQAEDDVTLDATRWMLDMMSLGLIQQYQTATIEDPQALELLGLKPNEGGRYNLRRAQDKFDKVMEHARGIAKKDRKDWNRLDMQLLRLAFQISDKYYKGEEMARGMDKRGIDPNELKVIRIENLDVLAMLGLQQRPGFRYSVREIRNNESQFQEFLSRALQLYQYRQSGEKVENLTDVKTLDLLGQLNTYWEVAELRGVRMVPVEGGANWKTLSQALEQMEATGTDIPPARNLADVLYAYAANKPEQFNKSLAAYQQSLAEHYPTEVKTSRMELFFNDFSPFYLCTVFYVVVLVLCCLSWIGWRDTFNRTAFGLALLVLLVHTWALGARMYIMGRPPVTNLYSSAVFIGWGCVLLCLILEWIYGNGIGTLVGAVTGFLTLLVAQHLLDSGETMEVLQAVLDTNFWLATHVVCVTLGYTATFVAGFLGIAYIFFGFVTPLLRDRDTAKSMAFMIYGVACFATLLSFVGTVLGGIWADQSWGRFWGWDPKENGALLIVIWNALILHARWGGMIKERGLAVLAVAGNMITAWSWFGTNQLGVGLHAYGFNNKLATSLVIFWFSQLLFIALGSLPLRWWWSFAPQTQLGSLSVPDIRKGRKLSKA